jgi:hypothetical protein
MIVLPSSPHCTGGGIWMELKEELDSKFKLEVHNDEPEKFCERFPPMLGSGQKRCSVQVALQAWWQ